MLTWIVTSSVIAAFSATILKAFDEPDEELQSGEAAGLLLAGPHRPNWETMRETDLDALLEEFAAAGEPVPNH